MLPGGCRAGYGSRTMILPSFDIRMISSSSGASGALTGVLACNDWDCRQNQREDQQAL